MTHSLKTGAANLSANHAIGNQTKQGLIATQLSVLEAFVIKVDENIHPWYYLAEYLSLVAPVHVYSRQCTLFSGGTVRTGSA